MGWPKLSDEVPHGGEVKVFFENFEDICALANDGAGMLPSERLRTLKSLLVGARLEMYNSIFTRKIIFIFRQISPNFKIFSDC